MRSQDVRPCRTSMATRRRAAVQDKEEEKEEEEKEEEEKKKKKKKKKKSLSCLFLQKQQRLVPKLRVLGIPLTNLYLILSLTPCPPPASPAKLIPANWFIVCWFITISTTTTIIGATSSS
jgi:hypothetical protein